MKRQENREWRKYQVKPGVNYGRFAWFDLVFFPLAIFLALHLCEALSGINLETVSLRVKQKEAIRNIVLLKKDTLIILPTGFGN